MNDNADDAIMTYEISRWMPIDDAINRLGELATVENRLTRPERDAVEMGYYSLQRSRGVLVQQFYDMSVPSGNGAVILCCPRCRARIKVGYNIRKDIAITPNFCSNCGQRLLYNKEKGKQHGEG